MGLKARLLHFEAIDSTNAEAHRLAANGERGPLWIVSDLQSQGRGRLGRHWVSEPGNLYATFVFTLQGSALTASQMGFVAALAIRDTALALLPKKAPPVMIKWPNDVQLGGAKLSGILVETVAQPTEGHITVAIGMGLNLAHAPEGTPYPAAALAHHGVNATPREGLETLEGALSYWLSVWQEGRGFAAIRESWLKDAAGLGQEFTATVNNNEIRGRFESLGEDGAMILALADGSLKSIHSGEVQVRRT
jgi:BirA family biotin operon repressor/biotin-[acetyl-CoA-carboxylase] ligase